MANGYFAWENRLLSGTLAAGSEAAGLPITNIRGPHGNDAYAWRTAAGVDTSAAGSWFTLDFGSTTTFRVFSLHRTNLSGSATVRWRVHSAPISSGTVTTFDTGAVAAGVAGGIGQSVKTQSADQSGRYLRCDIEDGSNPDAFVSIGLAYAGPIWQPAVNFSPSTALAPTRGQQLTRTRAGLTYLTPTYYERAWKVVYESIDGAELWTKLFLLDQAAALGTNILFMPDSASTFNAREAVFGLLESTSDIGFDDLGGTRRTWAARIAERL